MKLTARQSQAVGVLKKHPNVLFFGGSRSGKTFITTTFCVQAAARLPVRALIARRYATDVRASIWKLTLIEVLRIHGFVMGEDYRLNESTMACTFPSGGVILVAGLDDQERVDKILGQEFAIIYLNEAKDVPWSTVNILKTRLSQNVPKFTNRFICDLNPPTDAHWTFRLFFDHVHPESKLPIDGSKYGALQMNPQDNAENLPAGYIEDQLGSLVGNARQRFLLGEFQTTGGLKVFAPKSLYFWPEFEAWAYNRQGSLRFIGGLDLGFNDADAFVIIAFVPYEPDVWIVYEHKARRQGIAELVQAIRDGIAWVGANVPARDHSLKIYAETATIRHGHEGDDKKSASMLAETYGLPIMKAYKRDKKLGIELLQDAVNSGKLHLPHGGPFHEETDMTIWTRNPEGTIERVIDDEAYHPDLMDAVLYPMREVWSYGGDSHKQLPPPPPSPDPPTEEAVMLARFEKDPVDENWDIW